VRRKSTIKAACYIIPYIESLFEIVIPDEFLSLIIIHAFEEEISKNTKKIKYLSELFYDFEAGRDLRIYNGNGMISGRYMDEILYARKIEIKKQRKDFLINLVIGVCKLAELFLIYLLAINKYVAGGLMLVNFILYINASYQIASSISEIVWTVSVLYTASIYYEDFNKYMKLEETIRKEGSSIPPSGSCVPFIEFRNVSFKYPNQDKLKKPPRTSPQNGKSPRRYSFIGSALFRWCPFLPQKIVPRFSVPEPVLASRSVPCGSPGKRLSFWSVALQTPHPTP
jgi:ABC-type multidrug transport system fused ATPase/permease subunit